MIPVIMQTSFEGADHRARLSTTHLESVDIVASAASMMVSPSWRIPYHPLSYLRTALASGAESFPPRQCMEVSHSSFVSSHLQHRLEWNQVRSRYETKHPRNAPTESDCPRRSLRSNTVCKKLSKDQPSWDTDDLMVS